MRLADDIRRMIDLMLDRYVVDARVHERWLRMSGGSSVPEPDYLPVLVKGFDRDNPDEWKRIWPGHLRYSLQEQIDDPEKMLWEQLVQLVPLTRFPGDGVPSVAPRFGNAFLLSAIGVDMKVVDDTTWPERHLTREEIRTCSLPDDYTQCKWIRKAIDFVQYAQSVLPPEIPVGLFFMMSPYDLAYLARGDELMEDMYDSGDDVHRFMDVCTQLFIDTTKLLKDLVGEPPDRYVYGNGQLFAGGGQLCEDACVMLSPQLHKEFSVPYTRRALETLGGGWIHFCGDGRHIIGHYLEMPNVSGIQFGQLALNGPIEETAELFVKHGKSLNYNLEKLQSESWESHFRRVLQPFPKRKYLFGSAFAFTDQSDVGESLRDIWHKVQDEMFCS